jgi:hypothetical protein
VLDVAKAVDPGDRYPTSGLPAPSQAVLQWDEHSYVSEDSTEENRPKNVNGKQARRGSIRARLGKGRWVQRKRGKQAQQEEDEEPTAMSYHEVKAKKLVTRLKSLF